MLRVDSFGCQIKRQVTMDRCRHQHLILITESANRLRCRHCHLTIKPDELDFGYCPECYEARGKKHNDFEAIESDATTKYRCETCHAVIEYKVHAKK